MCLHSGTASAVFLNKESLRHDYRSHLQAFVMWSGITYSQSQNAENECNLAHWEFFYSYNGSTSYSLQTQIIPGCGQPIWISWEALSAKETTKTVKPDARHFCGAIESSFWLLDNFFQVFVHIAEENHTKKLDKKRQRVRKYCSDTRLSVILKLIKPSYVCIFVLLHSQVRLFVGYWKFCSLCQALTTMAKGMKPLQSIVAHFVVQACTTFLHYTIASNFCLIILHTNILQ